MTAEEALDWLVSTLEQLRELLPPDQRAWTSQPLLGLAVEQLWITAGNMAEAHRIERGIATGVEPWSELVDDRHLLAHALPGDLSSDRLFADATAELDRLLASVGRDQG